MKKILFAVLVFTVTCANAQKFQLGAKAGLNISNFTGGDFDEVDKKALMGFHGGLYLRFSFGNLGIQPEAMISTQGAKIDSITGGSYDWKVTYVTIPVMLQYRFQHGLYLEAGPQVGFKIGDHIKDETIEDFAKNLDLSIGAGFGYRGKKGLGIGARYMVGLSKVGDFQTSTGIDPDFKNSVVQFSIYIPLTPAK